MSSIDERRRDALQPRPLHVSMRPGQGTGQPATPRHAINFLDEGPAMKSDVIDLLEFPRRLLQDSVQIDDCPHAGNFAPADHTCRVCETRAECEWLHHNDACAGLALKPIDAAIDALVVAMLYVDARVTHAGHRRHGCKCEACAWLRKARAAHESGFI